MRIAHFLLAFVLSSSLVLTSPAQQPASAQQPAPTTSPQAVELLQHSLTALVGNTKVSDITLSGSARRIAGSDDESGSVTLKALPTGESHLELSFASGPLTEVRGNSNGNLTGSWSSADGVAHPIAFHNLLADIGLCPALTLAAFASSSNAVITYVGAETRNGQAVQHITATQQAPGLTDRAAMLAQQLSQMEIYLDASTLLPIAVTFNTHPDGDALRDIPVEVDFSTYTPVGGVLLPFHVQKSINHTLALDLQFNRATLNTGFSASEFNVL